MGKGFPMGGKWVADFSTGWKKGDGFPMNGKTFPSPFPLATKNPAETFTSAGDAVCVVLYFRGIRFRDALRFRFAQSFGFGVGEGLHLRQRSGPKVGGQRFPGLDRVSDVPDFAG